MWMVDNPGVPQVFKTIAPQRRTQVHLNVPTSCGESEGGGTPEDVHYEKHMAGDRKSLDPGGGGVNERKQNRNRGK